MPEKNPRSPRAQEIEDAADKLEDDADALESRMRMPDLDPEGDGAGEAGGLVP